MARISKHGSEIGTIHYLTKSVKYMSDGVLLVNRGFGWKIGKVRDGVTIDAARYQWAKEQQDELLATRPAIAHYRKLLHGLAGVGKRWKLHAAVQMMPDDCDGVWSDCCDGYGDNVSASVDEIAELCRAYKIAMQEADEIRNPDPTAWVTAAAR